MTAAAPSTHKSGAQVVADFTIFAPLGLLITAAEAVPELAGKARARLVPRVGLARTVGQFAVRQGCKQLSSLAGDMKPPRMPWAGRGDRPDFRGAGRRPMRAEPPVRPERPVRPAPPEARHDGPAGRPFIPPASVPKAETARLDAPHSADLAIPSYDSLSAPQVVQRLAGLSREEIEAVRRYEAVTRGRRTILARAEQLLS